MFIVNLNVPYKPQTDNLYRPSATCNLTSVAMCLAFLGIGRKPEYSRFAQFEDELFQFARDNGYSIFDPLDLSRIMISYGANNNVSYNSTVAEMKEHLDSGYPCIVHGYFTRSGHIVVVRGYDDKGCFVNDPWGEWFYDGYRNHGLGENLHYSWSLMERTCWYDGQFWLHRVKRRSV